MNIQIKTLAGTVRFEGDFSSLAEAVEAAVESGASLSRADLSGAKLSGANLSGADLHGANLPGADLPGANLSRASLSRANLSRANLSGADLSGAKLSGANLSGASLSRADLSGADLSGAKLNNGEIVLEKERPFFSVGPVGSRSAILLAFATHKGIRLKTGCFFGSIDEFKASAAKTHGDNIHLQEYAAALAMIETHFKLWL